MTQTYEEYLINEIKEYSEPLDATLKSIWNEMTNRIGQTMTQELRTTLFNRVGVCVRESVKLGHSTGRYKENKTNDIYKLALELAMKDAVNGKLNTDVRWDSLSTKYIKRAEKKQSNDFETKYEDVVDVSTKFKIPVEMIGKASKKGELKIVVEKGRKSRYVNTDEFMEWRNANRERISDELRSRVEEG